MKDLRKAENTRKVPKMPRLGAYQKREDWYGKGEKPKGLKHGG
jgi:hypothetical protein